MRRIHACIVAGAGCGAVVLALVAAILLVAFVPIPRFVRTSRGLEATSLPPQAVAIERAAPTITVAQSTEPSRVGQQGSVPGELPALYRQLNPGVVNIQVRVEQFGQSGSSTGSGFILDEDGHIITNNHVVAGATSVTVVFYDGLDVEAEIVGTDDDSDLAVIKVADLPPNVYPLALGASDQVEAGDWVVAFGSPFGLGSTMTLGIVSATGRAIPSGATPFSIPQAIQTDAAINPGNSGGPLLNLRGQVVGVNAQIASGGGSNSGVGFAIPSNVVRRVAPSLIADGFHQWPWLGVTGGSATLLMRRANDLEGQRGAYIGLVEPGGPADQAGLRGSTGTTQIDGRNVPVGGDVIIEVDGSPVLEFDDLLVQTALRSPGDQMEFVVLRQGQRLSLTATLWLGPRSSIASWPESQEPKESSSTMEGKIIYFDSVGSQNTGETLQAGRARAKVLGLKYVVVASITGETALRAAGAFQGLDVTIIVVTERVGTRLGQENRDRLAALGATVLTGIHAFHSVESAAYDVLGGAAHEKIIAETLRWFSEGTKVAVECVLMAVDAGLVPMGEEVLAFGGTGGGTDTALVLRSAGVWDMFSRDREKRLAIREILALPRRARLVAGRSSSTL